MTFLSSFIYTSLNKVAIGLIWKSMEIVDFWSPTFLKISSPDSAQKKIFIRMLVTKSQQSQLTSIVSQWGPTMILVNFVLQNIVFVFSADERNEYRFGRRGEEKMMAI